MKGTAEASFEEVQYMRHVWWLLLLIAGVTVLSWWGFIQQILLGKSWGSNPGPDWLIWLIWLIVGIGFPVIFFVMRLVVTVMDDHLTISFIPLTKRVIPLADIQDVQARTYHALLEYGGWGIRGRSNRRAYNVSGNRGVELTLYDGRIVMIGSQKAERLALAIESNLSR
ncbi:MAG: DUF6141 family protein [Candidatus Promineifilaceae bacterium]|nr:DUF6141 family protein [Candidatus Promineifilaceae bacterium]